MQMCCVESGNIMIQAIRIISTASRTLHTTRCTPLSSQRHPSHGFSPILWTLPPGLEKTRLWLHQSQQIKNTIKCAMAFLVVVFEKFEALKPILYTLSPLVISPKNKLLSFCCIFFYIHEENEDNQNIFLSLKTKKYDSSQDRVKTWRDHV